MSALDRIISDARYHRVSFALQWVVYRPAEEREPTVTLAINDTKWTLYFTKGKRSWLLKTAVSSRRTITTLAGVLDLIAEEGARRDAEEKAAQDELAAQVAWEQQQAGGAA